MTAQEGVKGGTLAGGPPFAGGPRRPQPMLHHNARGHPPPVVDGTPPLRGVGVTWWGRRWTKGRVVEDADPYGGGETGRVPRDLLRYYPAPGRGSAERGKAGGDRDGGTSGTPSPTGRLRRRGAGGRPASGRGWNPAPTVGWQNAATFMGRRGSRPAIISKTPPDGRRFHLFIMSAERILERSKTGATGGRGQSFYA